MIELQGQVGGPTCVPVLLGLLNDARQPGTIRKAAIAARPASMIRRFPLQTLAEFSKLPANCVGPRWVCCAAARPGL